MAGYAGRPSKEASGGLATRFRKMGSAHFLSRQNPQLIGDFAVESGVGDCKGLWRMAGGHPAFTVASLVARVNEFRRNE